MRGSILWGACVVALTAVGCDDDDDDVDGGGLAVATYNAGLAPGFEPLVEERVPRVIAALADQPLDVLCVQEFWLPESARALRAATAEELPNTIFPPPDPGEAPSEEPACTSEELAPLVGCAQASCAGVGTEELADCVLASCGAELAGVPDVCATCLAANIGASLDAVQVACTTAPGGAFAFEGSFGIGLLTDSAILEQDLRVLESSFARRGVIHARLSTVEVGAVHAFCTHLTPIFDDIPFPGEGSWEDEQARQIASLADFVAEKTAPGDRVVLLGDLNTGPGIDDVDAEAPENFAALIAAGDFEAPYLRPGAECTFCAANPLVPDDSDSVIIDHVLVRGFGADVRTERILTGEIQLNVDGSEVTTAFSDHYGVMADLGD